MIALGDYYGSYLTWRPIAIMVGFVVDSHIVIKVKPTCSRGTP